MGLAEGIIDTFLVFFLQKEVKRLQPIIEELQDVVANSVEAFKSLDSQISTIEEILKTIRKENNLCQNVGDASLKTLEEIEVSRRTEKEEVETRFMGKVKAKFLNAIWIIFRSVNIIPH